MQLMRTNGTAGFSACLNCIVRDHGICGALTQEELAEFHRIARRSTFEHGSRIMSGGEDAEFVASIITGVVKVSKVLADGRQQIVGLLFPTESIGRAFGNPDSYFAEAATHVELCCFEKASFERMLETHPGLSRRLLEQAQAELNMAHDWMVLLGRKTSEERVASLLLMLATRAQLPTPARAGTDGDTDNQHRSFDLYLKRNEIADFLGLTLETVSRQISALKRNGLISFSGTQRFSVPDSAARLAAADRGEQLAPDPSGAR